MFLPCSFFFMIALCNSADHYIFAVVSIFLLLSSFLPRLISVAVFGLSRFSAQNPTLSSESTFRHL